MVAKLIDSVEGAVSRVNGHGFQLQGRSAWLNLSRYADPPPPLPMVGAWVKVGLDSRGFVHSVDVVEREPVGTVGPIGPTPETDTEARITRLAVLNTASRILASGNRAAAADEVVKLAGRLEQWVNR